MMNDAESTSPTRTDNQIGKQIAPQQSISDKSEPSLPSEEEANWVAVIRWATVHSGPSVSAPTVRFYSVGTELQLIGYQHGWFQVLDPATSQRGWIYAKYYLQAIRGPGQGIADLQEPAKPRNWLTHEIQPARETRKELRTRPPNKIRPAHRKRSSLPIRDCGQYTGQGPSTVVRRAESCVFVPIKVPLRRRP